MYHKRIDNASKMVYNNGMEKTRYYADLMKCPKTGAFDLMFMREKVMPPKGQEQKMALCNAKHFQNIKDQLDRVSQIPDFSKRKEAEAELAQKYVALAPDGNLRDTIKTLEQSANEVFHGLDEIDKAILMNNANAQFLTPIVDRPRAVGAQNLAPAAQQYQR
jgi:hypothetical protein